MFRRTQLVCTVTALTILTRLQVERDRVVERLRDERAMTTETVIITAVLAALAIAVGTIITLKVTNKANSINLGG